MQVPEKPEDPDSNDLDNTRAQNIESRNSTIDSIGTFAASQSISHVGLNKIRLSTETLPGAIGRYLPKKVLGKGGMGTVYLARQDIPVQRNVALKVINSGKDTQEVVARFEAERQAIAIMSHQNVAKLLDAGVTNEGLPYFVMEYVIGRHITDYCDEKQLTVQQRLELFLGVCSGVEHAHQKGLIHRDLKPSNIIVTDEQQGPKPKIIDFGLAKAIESDTKLVETQLTEIGQILGTVQYMSPEQALQGANDLDVRTDIYSLGILLYELLTGGTPLQRETIETKGILEIIEIIRSKDPIRPSIYLSGLGDDLKRISEKRRNSPSRLRHSIQGDLDWIVMKALDIDRNRRYSSTTQFAEDVEKYLNNEPVLARPPSTTYRIKKLIKRNRLAVIFTAALSLTMLAATVISVFWAIKANAAEHRSNVAKDRAIGTLGSIQQFVLESPVWRTKNPAREALLDLMTKELSFWVEDSGEYNIDASTIAPVMVRLAALEREMGRQKNSEEMATNAIRLLEKEGKLSHPETQITLAEAEALLAELEFFEKNLESVRQLGVRIEARFAKVDSASLSQSLAIRYCKAMFSMTMFCYYEQFSTKTYSKACELNSFCQQFLSEFPESGELKYQLARSLNLMGKAIHKSRASPAELKSEKQHYVDRYNKSEEILNELVASNFRVPQCKQLICEVISNRGLAYRFYVYEGRITFDQGIKNYNRGLAICEEALEKYPGNLLFEETKGLLLLNKSDFLSDFPQAVEEELSRIEAYEILKEVISNTSFRSEAGRNFTLNQLGRMTNKIRLDKASEAIELAVELYELDPKLEELNAFRLLAYYQLLQKSDRFTEKEKTQLNNKAKSFLEVVLAKPDNYLHHSYSTVFFQSPLFKEYRSDPKFAEVIKEIADAAAAIEAAK